MITIENLAFSYGPTPVLKNISLRLEEGKIYGLLGENGVGKTTLLTLLCGLKRVDAGRILTDGKEPYGRDAEFLADQGCGVKVNLGVDGRHMPRIMSCLMISPAVLPMRSVRSRTVIVSPDI